MTTASYIPQQALPSPLSVLMPTQQCSQPSYHHQPQQNGMPYLQSQSRPENQWLLPVRNQANSRSTGIGSSVSSDQSSPREIDSDRSAEERQTAVVSVSGGDEPPQTPKTSAISPNPEDSPIAHSVLSGAKKIDEQYGWVVFLAESDRIVHFTADVGAKLPVANYLPTVIRCACKLRWVSCSHQRCVSMPVNYGSELLMVGI
jgi:hypothetical protein